MSTPSFPLFRSALESPPEVLPPGVSDVFHNEVLRAALAGADPEADPRIQMTLDLPSVAMRALQALAVSTGSSRRAMGGKLLQSAIWESVNALYAGASGATPIPEYEAVLEEFTVAFNASERVATK